MEDIFLIKGTSRFYISSLGYVYKESKNGKVKKIMPIRMIKGIPRVNVENKKLNLVLLMIEYFYTGNLIGDFNYSYKIHDDRIPLKNITIKFDNSNNEHDRLIFLYKCDSKAQSSNYRVSHVQKLTSEDVLNCLIRTDFKCTYCGDKLNPRKWHLDHVYPLAKGGHNVFTNITPACKECNLMKRDMGLDKFIRQCKLISENYK